MSGLDSRSSRIVGSVVYGSCSVCDVRIMAVRPAGAPVEGTVAYVEQVGPDDGPTANVGTDGLLREGVPEWATILVKPHACFTPSPPPPPSKATAKKAPARTRKKETP